ncbi:hypothetical protein A0H81_05228 [Grifola frondosa]|uniref:Uncharacterized protein n=1 Tax=Grifola frondosa TaxID=5627 RepID=A0A1C7MC36_GRIFR|nr:hypothetical protein A0H81_05228 [Grifola frondosa]
MALFHPGARIFLSTKRCPSLSSWTGTQIDLGVSRGRRPSMRYRRLPRTPLLACPKAQVLKLRRAGVPHTPRTYVQVLPPSAKCLISGVMRPRGMRGRDVSRSASATSSHISISTKYLLSSSPYLYLARADLASAPLSWAACCVAPAPSSYGHRLRGWSRSSGVRGCCDVTLDDARSDRPSAGCAHPFLVVCAHAAARSCFYMSMRLHGTHTPFSIDRSAQAARGAINTDTAHARSSANGSASPRMDKHARARTYYILITYAGVCAAECCRLHRGDHGRAVRPRSADAFRVHLRGGTRRSNTMSPNIISMRDERRRADPELMRCSVEVGRVACIRKKEGAPVCGGARARWWGVVAHYEWYFRHAPPLPRIRRRANAKAGRRA